MRLQSAICMLQVIQRLNISLRLPFSMPSFHHLFPSEDILRRNIPQQKYCCSAVNYVLLWIANQSMYNEYFLKPNRFLILNSPHLPAATLNFSKRYTSHGLQICFVKLQYVKSTVISLSIEIPLVAFMIQQLVIDMNCNHCLLQLSSDCFRYVH